MKKGLSEWKIIDNFAQFFVNSRHSVGKFTEYKIPLMSLPEGEQTFNFHLDKRFFENMENPDIHDANLRVELTVTNRSGLYHFAFVIKGTITLICDRCLDDLVQDVDTTYSISVKYGEDYNDESDELLVIPSTDSYLNVAYMIHDTVALTIPIKHVHPLGKCNRQMTAMLRKHRTHRSDDEDAELEDRLIDEMESMDAGAEGAASDGGDAATDPRWDALKGLASDGN